MDISSAPFFFRCVEENLASVSYTPPHALYLSFGLHNHLARASSLSTAVMRSGWFARLFWVMPCSIPPRLCFPVLVLSCTQKTVSDASLLRLPSQNDGFYLFIFNPFSLPLAAFGTLGIILHYTDAWNDGFLSASNSLGSSRSGVQRHLRRVELADCIPGRQITRLRHNHVLAAGFFPYRFTFGLFSFVIDGWETFGVPSL
jgi:hypothetical protein